MNRRNFLKLSAFSIFLPLVSRFKAKPLPTPIRFAFLTDIHVGRANTYAPGEPQSIIDHILSLDLDFIITNGDDTDHGTAEEMQVFLDLWTNATIPVYFLPGNHDEVGEYDDPPPNDYTNYIEFVNVWKWAFNRLNFRLVGFTSNLKRDEPLQGVGWLDQRTKNYLGKQAANLAGKIPLLFTHFPLHDFYGNNIRDIGWMGQYNGQAEIFNVFSTAGKGLMFTGHRHVGYLPHASEVVPGLTELQGSCLAYNIGDPQGGYNIVTLTNNHVLVEVFRARAPFDKLTEMEFQF